MDKGEIWLVSLDPSSGHEQSGTRPVMIISPAAFNRCAQTPITLPITSGGNFAREAGFVVPLMGCGTETTGVVRCDQPRALDMKFRHGKKLEIVPDFVLEEVQAKLQAILFSE